MEAIATPDNTEAFLRLVLDAAQHGKWALFFALLITAAVFIARVVLAKKSPFFGTGAGALLLNALASAATGVVTAFMGAPATWAAVWAVLMSVLSTYGWSLVKVLGPLLMKIPALAGVFASLNPDSTEAKAKAAAGLAAANATPVKTAQDIVNGPK